MSDTINVLIPAALRPQAGDKDCLTIPSDQAGSVKNLLAAVTKDYPELGKRLFKDGDQLNRFINVYVNDEDIRFLDNLDTPVKATDEVAIVPAIAGG